MLKISSNEFSNHGCNDVDESIYEDWNIEERREFVKEIHEWNGDPECYDENFLHTPDWVLMSFLASKLEAEPTTDNWIKVSERLPEQIGSYLAFYRDGEGFKCMAWGFYNSNGEWIGDDTKLLNVTHWQPLPSAPLNGE